jgi:hypothetical protein
MKKKEIPTEDPAMFPGEVIWQVEIFHTVFPVGTNSWTLRRRKR